MIIFTSKRRIEIHNIIQIKKSKKENDYIRMNDTAEKIQNAISIVDLVSNYTKLIPSGNKLYGLCPLHNEKTPSFYVYPDTQSYYCFGCHKGGNIFSFVMDRENVNYSEALRILAHQAGINIEGKKNNSINVIKFAEEFFIHSLENSPGAKGYLSKRNIPESAVKSFRIGYAPQSWSSLMKSMNAHKISQKTILESGLVIQSQNGTYDRFRGRIIFPIRNIAGQTIAFGGRLITGEGAKYINSPEGPEYSKRKSLYLLDIARDNIRRRKRSILCEGYIDAIRLHISGFPEAVASLGTSLTAEQADLLSRYSDTCYICYDSDSAGQAATIRGMYILQSHGLDVRVITLPQGKDPDEYLLTHTHEDFEALISKAEPLIIAHLSFLRSRLNDTSQRKSALKDLFQSLKSLPPNEVFEYKAQLCEATNFLPREIDEIILSKSSNPPENISHNIIDPPVLNSLFNLESALCYLLMNSSFARLSLSPQEAQSILTDADTKTLAFQLLTEPIDSLSELWLNLGETRKFGIIEHGKIFCSQMLGMDEKEKFSRVYSSLKRASLDRTIAEIEALPSNERDIKKLAVLYLEREKYKI